MEKTNSEILASNIKYIRKMHKDTLESLAKALQVSKSSISDYEKNYTLPSLFFLDAFCKHYNVELGLIRQVDFRSASIYQKRIPQGVSFEINETGPQGIVQSDEKNLKLLEQRMQGLEVQLKLMSQLNSAREIENRTLKMQLELLSERLSKMHSNN